MSNPQNSQRPRWQALDFWRGYLLCTIFINHVPGNAFEPLTQKNFGFSDSAEGFVFLSGVSIALAYGRRLAQGEWSVVTSSLLRRAAKLYGAHIALSLLGLAIFAAGAMFMKTGTLLQVHGRDLAVAAPGEMLLGVLSLGHQFGYFNILPMYILMIVIAPALLWVGRTSPWPMVAASFLLYLLAVTRGWNLPTWPEKGFWFFDPFSWQFLMAIGIATGLAARRMAVPKLPSLTVVSMLVIGWGAFTVTNGFSFWPGLDDWTRGWADIDKTTLGLGRLVHFFAVAYVIHGLRVADWFRRSVVFEPLCTIGRHSLWIFALLSLLAAVGQVVMEYAGHTAVTDVAMMVLGLLALYGTAATLERRRTIGVRPAPDGAEGSPATGDQVYAGRGFIVSGGARLVRLAGAMRVRRVDEQARYGLR